MAIVLYSLRYSWSNSQNCKKSLCTILLTVGAEYITPKMLSKIYVNGACETIVYAHTISNENQIDCAYITKVNCTRNNYVLFR